MSFFYLFIYFIVIANIFFFLQIDRLEPSFTDSVFRFRFRIPCFSAADFKIIFSQKSNAAESNHSDETDIGGIYITFSEKHFSAKVY